MGYCYLVSRPLKHLEHLEPGDAPKWAVIGNGRPVPSLAERKPFLEHWALCIVPTAREVDPSDPASRDAFLRASYFDMGIESSKAGFWSGGGNADATAVESDLVWSEKSIRRITCVQRLGYTANTEVMISGCKRVLIDLWGKYLPFLWNCQHLAMMLSRIVVNSPDCAATIKHLLWIRSEWEESMAVTRHGGFLTALAASAFIPIVGPAAVTFGGWLAAGTYMVADIMKEDNVREKWRELTRRYPQLEDVAPQYESSEYDDFDY